MGVAAEDSLTLEELSLLPTHRGGGCMWSIPLRRLAKRLTRQLLDQVLLCLMSYILRWLTLLHFVCYLYNIIWLMLD